MPYPIGQSGPTTGSQQLAVTIGTGSSDRLVLTGAGWNGHTRRLSVTGYDANAGALYSVRDQDRQADHRAVAGPGRLQRNGQERNSLPVPHC